MRLELERILSVEVRAEGDGTVYVELQASDGSFAGLAEGWVGDESLASFCAALRQHPLIEAPAIEAGRGLVNTAEILDFRLTVRQVGALGRIGVAVELQSDVAVTDLRNARNRVVLELFTTYADIDVFASSLAAALRTGQGKALLRTEQLP